MDIATRVNIIKKHIEEVEGLLAATTSSQIKLICTEEFNLLKAQFELWLLLCFSEDYDGLYDLSFTQLLPLLFEIIPLNVLKVPSRIFTLEELQLDYTGLNGTPYYLIINGYIIDISHSLQLSPLWYAHPLCDLTLKDYLSKHSSIFFIKALTTAPILGRLIT